MTTEIKYSKKIPSHHEVYDWFANHNIKAIKFFIDSRGFDIIRDEYGNNPLHLACDFGYTELVDYLIKSGADIHSKNAHNETPLFVTSWQGLVNKDIIKLFINQGIDINIQDKLGNTLLHNSCRISNYQLIEFLLGQEIDINITNMHSETALQIAKEYRVPEIINVFRAHKEYNDLKQSMSLLNNSTIQN